MYKVINHVSILKNKQRGSCHESPQYDALVHCWGCRMAVLEMEKKEKVDVVVTQLRDYMLMVGGMPRPARALPATPVMLVDHPCTRKRVPVNLRIVPHTEENSKQFSVKRRKLVEQLKAAKYLREVCSLLTHFSIQNLHIHYFHV